MEQGLVPALFLLLYLVVKSRGCTILSLSTNQKPKQHHLSKNKHPQNLPSKTNTTFIMGLGQEDTGVTKAAKGVTGVLGNTVTSSSCYRYNSLILILQVGGLTNTVGGVVGAAGRGIGETVSGATGGISNFAS